MKSPNFHATLRTCSEKIACSLEGFWQNHLFKVHVTLLYASLLDGTIVTPNHVPWAAVGEDECDVPPIVSSLGGFCEMGLLVRFYCILLMFPVCQIQNYRVPFSPAFPRRPFWISNWLPSWITIWPQLSYSTGYRRGWTMMAETMF